VLTSQAAGFRAHCYESKGEQWLTTRGTDFSKWTFDTSSYTHTPVQCPARPCLSNTTYDLGVPGLLAGLGEVPNSLGGDITGAPSGSTAAATCDAREYEEERAPLYTKTLLTVVSSVLGWYFSENIYSH
jgi:hypothetical protein